MARAPTYARISRRIKELERQRQLHRIMPTYEVKAQDEAFFEHMVGRALAGDRDWSEEDRDRYHAILLDEPWGPQE